jgi:acyl-CoA thioesterase YciA
MSSDIGVHGNLFGGTMMSWIDEAGAAYSSQICDTPRMVTVKIDELVFKNPVKAGTIIKIYGTVKEFGNSSITLYVEVRKHNVYTGKQEVVVSTNIKFVRIDEEGYPIPISERIKIRYNERFEKYGKGLLNPDEK